MGLLYLLPLSYCYQNALPAAKRASKRVLSVAFESSVYISVLRHISKRSVFTVKLRPAVWLPDTEHVRLSYFSAMTTVN